MKCKCEHWEERIPQRKQPEITGREEGKDPEPSCTNWEAQIVGMSKDHTFFF